MPTNSTHLNRFALGAMIGLLVLLVAFPIAKRYIPVERAKWKLAAAKQALDTSNGDQQKLDAVQVQLNQAVELHPMIVESPDYQALQIRLKGKDSRTTLETISQLIATQKPPSQSSVFVIFLASFLRDGMIDESYRLLELEHDKPYFQEIRRDERNSYGILIASALLEKGREADSLSAIELAVPKLEERTDNVLNLFAYAASLADERLEEAKQAIDIVLKKRGNENNDAYLDTLAWVEHKLGNHQAALIPSHKSVLQQYQRIEKALESTPTLFRTPETDMLKSIRNIRRFDVISSFRDTELLQAMEIAESAAQDITQVAPETEAVDKASNEGSETIVDTQAADDDPPAVDDDAPEAENENTDVADTTHTDSEQAVADAADAESQASEVATDTEIATTEVGDDATNEVATTAQGSEVLPEATRKRAEQLQQSLRQRKPKFTIPSDPFSQFEMTPQELLKNIATLRYHRAEILRANGFPKVADSEEQAIRQLGFNKFDELR